MVLLDELVGLVHFFDFVSVVHFFLQVAASDPGRIKRRKSTAHETNQCDDGVVGGSDTVERAQSGTGPVGTGTTMHGGAGKK